MRKGLFYGAFFAATNVKEIAKKTAKYLTD